MKTHYIFPVFFLSLIFAFSLIPSNALYSAESQDTRSGKTGITYECDDNNGTTVTAGNCDFTDLVAAVKKVINWGIVFGLSFSVVVIAYAGYKYLISGENAGERKQANDMLQKVAIGIAWILGAWLVVNLITTQLMGLSLDNIF